MAYPVADIGAGQREIPQRHHSGHDLHVGSVDAAGVPLRIKP